MLTNFSIGKARRFRTILAIVLLHILGLGRAAEVFAHGHCAAHSTPSTPVEDSHWVASHGGHSNGSNQDAPEFCTCVGACAMAPHSGLPTEPLITEVPTLPGGAEPLVWASEELPKRDRYTLPYATPPPV